MIQIKLWLRILSVFVIVFGSIGMYFVWNKIQHTEDIIQEEPGTITTQVDDDKKNTDTPDTNEPIVSDITEPTSTDPTSPDKLAPSNPTPKTVLPPTPKSISCSEIRDATLKQCQTDCPPEPDIAVYNQCLANCDKNENLFTKSDCNNKCISDWSKAKSARSDCISGCLKDYYATDCP